MTDPLLASFTGGLSSAWHFFYSGGIFMLFIVICSIIAVATIWVKWRELRAERVMPPSLVSVLTGVHQGSGVTLPQVQSAINNHPSALSAVTRAAFIDGHQTHEAALAAAQATAREEFVKLERGVSWLEAIIAAAPLLGLLGAVVGLTKVFSGVGLAEADPALIAAGIAEALNTTIAGLVVAIPAVFFHVYFSRQLERLAARMEVLIHQALSGVSIGQG
jgi:biopolymer transport protein ExbB